MLRNFGLAMIIGGIFYAALENGNLWVAVPLGNL